MNEPDTSATQFSEAALEHLDSLYGFALALTHNRTEAQDLVQETYLRAVRAFGRLVPDSNLKGWLFAIMRNVWLNQIRHVRSGPEFVEIDHEESYQTGFFDGLTNNPQAILLRKIEREHVRDAIESLPRLYREVVVLRDIEGFTYQQIASIIGCPAGTVMSRLARAREKLRALLGQWYAGVIPGSVGAKEL